MGLISEFKEFAMKGNVVDMAVGIIIGGAFKGVVSSLVNDVIMPPIGMLIGGVNFSELTFPIGTTPAVLDDAGKVVEAAKQATINYGVFVQTVLDFLIVAAAVFVGIKAMNKASQMTGMAEEEEEAAPPEPSDEVKLLREIRDALQKS
ncbi:MAG: large-conductance mechanosensitive channel protein MscL [Planctomycetota bacterium]